MKHDEVKISFACYYCRHFYYYYYYYYYLRKRNAIFTLQ
jgi:hypothetical protein